MPLIQFIREILGGVRGRTRRVVRIGTRFRRTLNYVLDLLVWSRVFAARRNIGRLEITEGMLERKGVAFRQPSLCVTGRAGCEHWEPGFRAVYDLLFANLRNPDVVSPHRYGVPGPAFTGVYLWDSAFIAQVWAPWDLEVARDCIRSVVALRDGDRLQHVVSDFVRSGFTQPAVVAWSAVRLAERTIREGGSMPDKASLAFVREIFEPLVAYNGWLNKHRRCANGLYFWDHPYESGVENAPRFSSRDEKTLADTRHLAAPDMSSYLAMQCEALARMAGWLGREEEREHFTAELIRIRKAMNAILWSDDDGLYYDAYPDGSHIKSRTIASLIPLEAGAPDADRARRLLAHITDPAGFGSTMPLPSVALNDPDFARDMWRGPVWLNTAYLVVCGMERYGFAQEAAEAAWRLCDAVYRGIENENQVYEFYDPEHFHTQLLHRKQGNRWKAITLGSGPQKEFVGWSGLVNTLLVDTLLGARPGEDGQTQQRPNLPEQAAGLDFTLTLGRSASSQSEDLSRGVLG